MTTAERESGTPIEFTPVSANVGVEVAGLDLREPLSDADQQQLRALLDEHFLLVFRGQQLTADEQVSFLGTFGDVCAEHGDGKQTYYISNVHEDGALGEEELSFHSDWTWTTVPVHIASLCGVEVQGPSPATRFANGALAYAGLPTELKERIAPLHAMHLSYQPMMLKQHYAARQRLADLPPEATEADAPRVINPLVLEHPRVGTPIIYVNEFFTSHVVELPLDESEALLGELFDALHKPEYLYVHEWHEGDLVVWDNLAVQHARAAFRGLGARRTLRRASTTEGGKSPRQAAGLAPMRAKPSPTN